MSLAILTIPVHADGLPPSPPKNPILWLLDDLGALMENAASRISQPSTVTANKSTVESVAPSPQPNETELKANSLEAAAADQKAPLPIPAADTKTAAKLDPISWLFRDLAELFKPMLDPIARKRHPAEAEAMATTDT